MYSVKRITNDRRTEPHNVSVINGKTWGQRTLAKKQMRRSNRIDPYEYFSSKFVNDADHTERTTTDHREYTESDSRSYNANTPQDQAMKEYMHASGRYESQPLEGMSNIHSDLADAATDTYYKRLKFGMA